ncbi:hypothetical protein [Prosthecobacter sp.]|uniref:hypothetical protein n=1 Tax=Prosthecobacter sp. TaxID=1965333 RepID=UPI002ABA568B|nr:hypothetical protein [Prosthecobacter sp.]MDZ4405226.1 hypothetical protein [Prosthecobacter sp.]
MKASRCTIGCAARRFSLLTASVLLVQCSLPPRQAWQYIQTNGLLNYWGYSTQRQSPPFRTGTVRTQRYAATRSSSLYPRYSSRPSPNWSSLWGSGMPNRIPYNSSYFSGSSQNRYYNSPSPRSGSVATRPAPRPKSSYSPEDRSPSVKIPVEEPSPAPQIANNPPPVTSSNPAPSTSGSTSSTKPAAGDLPFGTPIPGRVNMVNSPYAGKTQLVDVSGMGVGQTVKCPYTGKLFKVPPSQQASNNTDSRQESKVETPKLSSDPKAEDKKP